MDTHATTTCGSPLRENTTTSCTNMSLLDTPHPQRDTPMRPSDNKAQDADEASLLWTGDPLPSSADIPLFVDRWIAIGRPRNASVAGHLCCCKAPFHPWRRSRGGWNDYTPRHGHLTGFFGGKVLALLIERAFGQKCGLFALKSGAFRFHDALGRVQASFCRPFQPVRYVANPPCPAMPKRAHWILCFEWGYQGYSCWGVNRRTGSQPVPHRAIFAAKTRCCSGGQARCLSYMGVLETPKYVLRGFQQRQPSANMMKFL